MDSKDTQKKEGEKQFSIQPIKQSDGQIDPKFAAHQAHPGPAISQNIPKAEGSRAERDARKAELNK